MSNFKITWIDRGEEPKGTANPAHPHGVDIDMTRGLEPSCRASLPYPAPRCGYYHIACRSCGLTVMVTTAGRRDDPCSIRVACKSHEDADLDEPNALRNRH
jgi:hypothetical protein